MNDINKKEVASRIKAIRQERGLTQDEFGKLFKATKGNVSLWEKGTVFPNNERLKMIADLGSISVNDLLYGSESENFFIPEYSKAMVYSFPATGENNHTDYKISLFFEDDPAIKKHKEGSFIMHLELSGRSRDELKKFTLNCRYEPSSDTRIFSVSVHLQQVVQMGTDISNQNNYYDYYSKRIGSKFYDSLEKSLRLAIKEYFSIISSVPLTVDIY